MVMEVNPSQQNQQKGRWEVLFHNIAADLLKSRNANFSKRARSICFKLQEIKDNLPYEMMGPTRKTVLSVIEKWS